MNHYALRLFVRSLLAEAKDKKPAKKAEKTEEKAPKSSGKLVDLKKELAALKQYKDELMTAKFAEKTASTEVEFADLAKFAKELDALKERGVKLEAEIDNKIAELETKISDAKNKIKEMMGLVPEGGQKKMVDEKKKPSAGMTKKEKSAVSKKAHAGEDIGKKGKGFEKVAKAAEKQYGSKEAGQKVAAAAMWKAQAKK